MAVSFEQRRARDINREEEALRRQAETRMMHLETKAPPKTAGDTRSCRTVWNRLSFRPLRKEHTLLTHGFWTPGFQNE